MPSNEKTSPPLLSIVQVTFNSERVIGACLDALAGLQNSEIIVVDNNSADSTCNKIRSTYSQVKLIQNSENKGFASATNSGAAVAKGKYLLLLNPDAEITPLAVQRAIDYLENNPDVGVLGPYTEEGSGDFKTLAAGFFPGLKNVFTHASGLSRFSKSIPWLRGHYLLKNQVSKDVELDVDWVSGACLFIRSEVWRELEGLSTRWFMYAEDIDLCFRVRKVGLRVVYGSGVLAKHQVGGSSGNEDKIGTLWIENLLDFYKQSMSKNWITTLLWKAIVSGGYWLRSAVLQLDKKNSHKKKSLRFTSYAKAIWKTEPKLNRAKYYPVARTVHLERMSEGVKNELWFTHTRADWDLTLYARTRRAKKVTLVSVLWRILTGPRLCLEVTEPLAFSSALSLTLISLAAQARNVLTGNQTITFVSYAIENLDPIQKLHIKFKLPKSIVKKVLSTYIQITTQNMRRIAFGTNASLEIYKAVIGEDDFEKGLKDGKYLYFPPFLPAAKLPEIDVRDPFKFGFVGPLEARKGYDFVIDAWAEVRELFPLASLDIYTPSIPNSELMSKLKLDSRITVFVQSPRANVLAAYSGFHVLLMPSRRTSVWKEQIGLPIIEGLSHGCEIVATTESGISEWLANYRHQVLDSDYSSAELVEAMSKAITSDRPREEITHALPQKDGRTVAEEWMFNEVE